MKQMAEERKKSKAALPSYNAVPPPPSLLAPVSAPAPVAEAMPAPERRKGKPALPSYNAVPPPPSLFAPASAPAPVAEAELAPERRKGKPALPSYNAVPPPPSLFVPDSSPSPSPLPVSAAASESAALRGRMEKPKVGNRGSSAQDQEREKERNICVRNSQRCNEGAQKWVPQDGNESSGASNSVENAAVESKIVKASLNDLSAQISNLSLLRSPSPSAMPNPTFRNKFREQSTAGLVPAGNVNEPKSMCESRSVADSETPSGTRLHLHRDVCSSPAEEKFTSQNYTRSPLPAKAEYLPVVVSKSKSVRRHEDHWSIEETSKALEAGKVFKSVFRVNTFNRNEAYATLKGVPTDILIDGYEKQNRAMEGDTVIMQLDPVSLWCNMKASSTKESSPSTCSAKDQPKCDLVSYPSSGSESCFQDVIDFVDMDDCVYVRTAKYEAQGSPRAVSLQDKVFKPSEPKGLQQGQVDIFQSLSPTRNGVNEPPIAIERLLQALESHTSVVETGDLQRESSDGKELYEGCFSRSDSLPQHEVEVISAALAQVTATVKSMPNKRPTGRVVHILEKSRRRQAIVGFLDFSSGTKHVARASGQSAESPQKHQKKCFPKALGEKLMLIPTDSRFPKMVVFVKHLPEDLKKRLKEGDATVCRELVAAQVDDWRADCEFPTAVIKQSLGQGGEIETQTAAILFEHAIHSASFPDACLDCLPKLPWKIPDDKLGERKDLRGCRIFSIDPPTAKDLDDALSIEQLDDGIFRVGVHIADVSSFVPADSALDKEARQRATSVYLIQRMLPMLPGLLCEELCSLNPGVDRLAFSVLWDLNASGQILDQWIGRTIIRSCCKLTYEHAQDMLDGLFDAKHGEGYIDMIKSKYFLPELHGQFTLEQIIGDVRALHSISQKLKEHRFQGGALKLDNSKLSFLLDDDGIPYDTFFYDYKQSNMLVEEFMLLANMTVAKVISGVFPDSALLRRHPQPNLRKLKELEEFCTKHGFELDTSSAGTLQLSLEKLREVLKHDPVLFSILLLYATKPMQLAKYFCTGEMRDNEDEWAHYALATPYYTHFTSPIRRYADIVVHRTLAAVLEAEQNICGVTGNGNKNGTSFVGGSRCFSGPTLDKEVADSSIGQRALGMAAVKYKVPGISDLAAVAAHCNERKLASRNVKDSTDKLFLWAMVKRNQGLVSDARVLNMGPKFISLFICKIGMERRIYYNEMDGLKVEWLKATGTLILDAIQRKSSSRKHGQGKQKNARDVALLVNPAHHIPTSVVDLSNEVEGAQSKPYSSEPTTLENNHLNGSYEEIEPAVLPIVLRPFSNVPVFLHAIGGETEPVDVGVRLYLSSYLY